MTFTGTLRMLSDVVDDIETTGATVLDADLGADGSGVCAELTVSTPIAPGYADNSSVALSAANSSIREDGSLIVDLRIDVPDETPRRNDVETDGGLVFDRVTEELAGTSKTEFPARFAYAQAAWLLVPLLALSATNVALELAFIAWFAGFLAISELTTVFGLPTRWRTGVRVLTMLGLLGVCYVVADRLLDVLPV